MQKRRFKDAVKFRIPPFGVRHEWLNYFRYNLNGQYIWVKGVRVK